MNAIVPITEFQAGATSAIGRADAPAIQIERLTKRFPGVTGAVLDDVSLTIDRGDIYGIIGRSGAGKSTLVRCINASERCRVRAKSCSRGAMLPR